MPSTRLIAIYEGGDLCVEDIERTVNDVLARSICPMDQPRLEGRRALLLDKPESGLLHVKWMTMRTEDGRRVTFEDQWIPLPEPPQTGREPVAVAVRWDMRPVRAGAVVECGVPELVRVAPGDLAREAGAITLGVLGPGGFQPVPVIGDRLDSNPTLLDWAASLRLELVEFESLLTAIALRLSCNGAPVLLWSALLQPILSGLSAAASSLSDEDDPRQAIRRVGELLAAFEALPERAIRTGDGHIVSLIEQAGFGGAGAVLETPALPEQCANLERHVRDRLADLRTLSHSMGTGLSRLPEWLYHGGKLYRKFGQADLHPFHSNDRTITYRIGSARLSPRAALAVLWDLSASDIRWGDVRFEPPPTGADRPRGKELYLESLRGMGYHWIEGHPLAGALLNTASNSRILDSAFYEPAT